MNLDVPSWYIQSVLWNQLYHVWQPPVLSILMQCSRSPDHHLLSLRTLLIYLSYYHLILFILGNFQHMSSLFSFSGLLSLFILIINVRNYIKCFCLFLSFLFTLSLHEYIHFLKKDYSSILLTYLSYYLEEYLEHSSCQIQLLKYKYTIHTYLAVSTTPLKCKESLYVKNSTHILIK